MAYCNVSVLAGQTLTSVERVGDEEIIFTADSGRRFKLYHEQGCCESVQIEDVNGDLNDLVGVPILQAEEVCFERDENPEGMAEPYGESFTWTFYKFATAKGYVTIRWLGESNGYYSESVDFCELPK
jgi:hypothetical protein